LFSQGLLSRLGRTYVMIPCTKRSILESTLPNLTNVSVIVTSVLSNFICDAGSLALDRIIDAANTEMTAHVQFLSRYSQSHPGVKIVIVPPLSRSEPDWFTPYLPCFTTYLFSEISKLGSTQIRYLSPNCLKCGFPQAKREGLTKYSLE